MNAKDIPHPDHLWLLDLTLVPASGFDVTSANRRPDIGMERH